MSIALPFFKRVLAPDLDWNALYADHVRRVFSYFRYRVGNEAVAEDLTALTFERAWRKRGQFKGDADTFVHWVFAIARNVANEYFRKEPTLMSLDEIISWVGAGDVADQVEQTHEFAMLVWHIRQLPERECDIITLKYGAGLTNRQIAKELSLSESNVGSILHRTIKKLRKTLEIDDE